MGWIDVNDKLPPDGLEVLMEVSGRYTGQSNIQADHGFFLGCWLNPDDKDPYWFIDDAYEDCCGDCQHIYDPVVHAWMPLPKHYQPQEHFTQEDDLMEHAMFEDDPDWLYKGDAVYEQMSLEDFLNQAERSEKCESAQQ